MSFTLRIEISGLCLLVPEGNQRLHVLMPSTATHDDGDHRDQHGPRIEPHRPWLIFDRAYLNQSDPLDTGDRVCIPLTGMLLQVAHDGGAIDTVSLPRQVVDLSRITKDTVSRELVTDLPDDHLPPVASRLTVTAGKVEGTHPGAVWELKGEKELAAQVDWEIHDIGGDSLQLTLQDSSGTRDLPRLYPRGTKADLVVVSVFNTTADDLPIAPPPPEGEKPDYDEPATHFAAYYTLFDYPDQTPLPRFRRLHNEMPGVRPYRCMLALATLQSSANA
jgi:hypothetical protein